MKVKFSIEVESAGAAMTENPHREVGRMLREVLRMVESAEVDEKGKPLRDFNGDTVGRVVLDIDRRDVQLIDRRCV